MPPNCIAIIPARGGSKRLPGKNLRHLGGLPLIGWTIRVAKAAGVFSRIVVSTDDPATADAALALGAEVPWLRSSENSSDTATSIQVVHEVLRRLLEDENYHPDAVMLLQPTSPFRSREMLREALRRYEASGNQSVVSVSPASPPPQWCFTVSDNGELYPWNKDAPLLRSQDTPPVYCLNGSLYLGSATTLLGTSSFYSEHTQALVVDNEVQSLDIDTPFDFMVAETAVANGLAKPEDYPCPV
jgi:CMP-N-acetylneuraminic acid synthetase